MATMRPVSSAEGFVSIMYEVGEENQIVQRARGEWLTSNCEGMGDWLNGTLCFLRTENLRTKIEFNPQAIIEAAKSHVKGRLETFELSFDDKTVIGGVVYYPEGWQQDDRSCAVLYHNPNACNVAEYFEGALFRQIPQQLAATFKRPIIVYDYRGTGLSANGDVYPTSYETIARDGQKILIEALRRFDRLTVMGSGLGGGVATVSLEEYLQGHPQDASRVSLINQDSFSKARRMALPGIIAELAASFFKDPLDAEKAMRSLIARKIQVLIIHHEYSSVIPVWARMAAVITEGPNVKIFYEKSSMHAEVWDIKNVLKEHHQ